MTFQLTRTLSVILFSHLHGAVVIDWTEADGPDMRSLHVCCWRPRDWLRWGYERDWYDGPWNSFWLGPFGMYCWRW